MFNSHPAHLGETIRRGWQRRDNDFLAFFIIYSVGGPMHEVSQKLHADSAVIWVHKAV